MNWPFALLVSSAFASPHTEVVDYQSRVNESAFTTAWIAKNTRALEGEDRTRLEGIRTDVLKVIRLNEEMWFTATGAPLPDPVERKNILDSLQAIPFYACVKDCACGAGEGKEGCIRGRQAAGGSIGFIALLPGCVLEGSRCGRRAVTLNEQVEKFLGVAAYELASHELNDSRAAKGAVAAGAVLHRTTREVNGMLGACPGPYSESALSFLREGGHLRTPSELQQSCLAEYLAPFKRPGSPCFLASVARKFRSPPTVYRCDSYCQGLLCRKTWHSPELIHFGAREVLLFPPSACAGRHPEFSSEFAHALLVGWVAEKSCIESFFTPIGKFPEGQSTEIPVELPAGPDVPLVE